MWKYIRVFIFIYSCFISHCDSWNLLGDNAYEYKDGEYIGISFNNDNVDITHKLFEKSIIMQPFTTISLQILDIPSYVSFILAQAHSYKYNISMSYNEVFESNTYVNGTNIGLVQINSGTPPHNMKFYIQNNNKEKVMVLVAFQPYLSGDPLPGGCNMEFNVEIAPFLLLTYTDSLVAMDMQPAALTGLNPECDSYPSPVDLEVYHFYLPERDFSSKTYFDAIKKMMTVEGMQKYGWEIPEPAEGSSLRRIHAAYRGTGAVYGVVARSPSGNVAAYVPALTYACGNHINIYDDCELFSAPLSEVLSAFMIFVGLFICLCGHRKFFIGSSLISFLWGTIIAYIFLGMHYGTGYGIDMLGVLSGFVFSLLWYFFWIFFGAPIVSALLSTLALGFLMASSIMYAGLGSALWLVYDFSFWSVFLSITVVVPVLFMSAMHIGNILACATIGAYVFITPIDHYVGSNLKYIFLNILRRAVDKDFRLALIDPPFEVTDLLLILTWLLLTVAGTMLQLYMQRRRAPFPPTSGWCVSSASLESGVGASQGAAGSGATAVTTSTMPRRSLLQRAAMMGGQGRGSERTPLLVDVRIPDESSPDSVFDSPPPPPPPARPHGDRPSASDLATNPEKLASKLLAVLEPNDK